MSKPSEESKNMPSCCGTASSESGAVSEGNENKESNQIKIDWLLWSSATVVISAYLSYLLLGDVFPHHWTVSFSQTIYELINTMWWSMLLAILFVGALSRIPQEFVVATLGKGGTWKGLFRATLAGLLMDLCSHGILMVGMQLYKRGASLGQVMAFLIASPWNSLSLTIILVALIGLGWTLLFVLLSMLIALVSGRIFDLLCTRGTLTSQAQQPELKTDFKFWPQAISGIKAIHFSVQFFTALLWAGLKGSRMVLRWLLFGIVIAALIRNFVATDTYQSLFGPTLMGLWLTLIAATIIEVCSEGASPIAADLINRAHAPGNSFTFLMAGVSTDYTEIMSIKDTTQSWKIALFLPLITLPQIIIVGYLLNALNSTY